MGCHRIRTPSTAVRRSRVSAAWRAASSGAAGAPENRTSAFHRPGALRPVAGEGGVAPETAPGTRRLLPSVRPARETGAARFALTGDPYGVAGAGPHPGAGPREKVKRTRRAPRRRPPPNRRPEGEHRRP